MTTPRNLVLLLSSGHTVRIALRDDDLTEYGDGPNGTHVRDLLLNMPAVVADASPEWTFAYIEDPTLTKWAEDGSGFEPPGDFQRISVEGPGAVIQHG